MRIQVSAIVLLGVIATSWAEPNELVAFACRYFEGMFNECPKVNGAWGSWGPYSQCSSNCTGGTRTRTRNCDNPTASSGGSMCPNIITDATETEDCNSEIACPVDGGWSNWSDFSGCTRTCGGGGTWTRQRVCDNPSPAHGGKTCPDDPVIETETCANNSCPVDGQWGEWSMYSGCTVTCGGGTQVRSRNCDSPESNNGGEACPPPSSEIRSCNPTPCLEAVCESKNYVYDVNTSICIQLYTEKKSFDEANETCTEDDAFLFKMDTTDKLEVALRIIKDRRTNIERFFIGAGYDGDDKVYRWLDGSRVTWIGDEPSPGTKTCVKIIKDYMEEASCSIEKYFFCQLTVPIWTAGSDSFFFKKEGPSMGPSMDPP